MRVLHSCALETETSRLQNPKHASSFGINGVKYYANFFSAHRVPSPPYSQAVIWFYVLQILKCLHGGCGQLNKQQLSPISGGQLLTKKAQGNQGKQRKGKQQSGRERERECCRAASVRNCCEFIKSRIERLPPPPSTSLLRL